MVDASVAHRALSLCNGFVIDDLNVLHRAELLAFAAADASLLIDLKLIGILLGHVAEVKPLSEEARDAVEDVDTLFRGLSLFLEFRCVYGLFLR